MQKRIRKLSSGLTLTELLVVVGILMFLVLMAIWYFRSQIFKGNDAKRKGDIKRIQVAIEEYEKDNDCYPTPDLVVCNPGTGLKPYINKIPCDPTTKASYYYDYEDSSCPRWYRLFAKLENENDEDVQVGIGPSGAYNYYASSPNAPPPTIAASGFYGCIDGVCVPIGWDESRPGPECDPNYQSPNCYEQCGPPQTECIPWNE
jgi:type II secretory pathway pseudopilin PulG